jgi:hypothetical protein
MSMARWTAGAQGRNGSVRKTTFQTAIGTVKRYAMMRRAWDQCDRARRFVGRSSQSRSRFGSSWIEWNRMTSRPGFVTARSVTVWTPRWLSAMGN